MFKKKDSHSLLVIDDDDGVLQAVQMALRTSDWKLTMTQDAKEGVELAHTLQPDVILCDAVMPGFTAAQISEALQSEPVAAAIPVILMTGRGTQKMFSHVRWTNFLAKPFGPEELRSALESALSSRERKMDGDADAKKQR